MINKGTQMTKFISIIPGKDFTVIDTKSVALYKRLAGKIPQNGIRYIEDMNKVILQSNNMFDIIQTAKNGGWAHTARPVRIKAGWEVVIVPSNPVIESYKELAVGVVFTATAESYVSKSEAKEMVWASESNLVA
jgi:hypothetical protein